MPGPARALRIAILTEWMLVVLLIVCEFALDLPLPAELHGYLEREQEGNWRALDIVLLIAIVVLLPLTIAASVGLWRFRRWGRSLYAILSVIGFLLLPLYGSVVAHSLVYTLEELAVFVSGTIIALSYYAPIEGLQRDEQA